MQLHPLHVEKINKTEIPHPESLDAGEDALWVLHGPSFPSFHPLHLAVLLWKRSIKNALHTPQLFTCPERYWEHTILFTKTTF